MENASAAYTSHPVSPSLVFRRVRMYQVLAFLALALAGFALFSPLIPALAEDASLRIPSLTGAIGFLAAFVLLRFLCMSTIAAQYFIMVPMVGLTLGVVSAFMLPELVPPVSIIAVLAAAYIFFYEQGIMVEISETGFLMISRFPLLKRVLISWDEIETVTADMRMITTRLVGESYGMTDQKNRLVVRGKGKTIMLGTPPYRRVGGPDLNASRWVTISYPLMAPAAVDWTVKQIRLQGSITLGPIEIANDMVSIGRRLGSTQQIRFTELRQVGLKAGYVHFETDSKTTKISLRSVPNGLYLPEILRAAGWRGEGNAAMAQGTGTTATGR
ncbi:MAG: hypothetical protein A2X57_12315 [Nitrospirae bacterium GWD2_57_8]|nr:MAG: hypothetical protein A2X57_12315 [Nitrospirae bacterium GWD2_57_8]